MDLRDAVQGELDELDNAGLLRKLRIFDHSTGRSVTLHGRELVSFAGNDYLGLAGHVRLAAAAEHAAREYGTGARASRLITGTTPLHEELERAIARFKGTEASIVFPTGYMAAVGTITALCGSNDAVILDKLCHACLIDGARLSGARVRTYSHLDVAKLQKALARSASARRKLVVTDSVFSMDGDLAPLPELVEICERHGAWLMVDEAHATGVFGPAGKGLAAEMGIADRVHVSMGTLSKALGSLGGYIAGSRELIELLHNRARTFIFTTGQPPGVAAASLEAIRMLEDGSAPIEKLWENVQLFAKKLAEHGAATSEVVSPVVPVVVGEASAAVRMSSELMERGYLVPAIRPPTVPKGKSRLRLSISAAHTPQDIAGLTRALGELLSRKPPAG